MSNLRNVVYGAAVSIDGYIARPDGSVDWLVQDPDYDWNAFWRTIDTLVLGRKTYDASVAMDGGAQFRKNKMPAYVFSQTQRPGKRDGVEWINETPSVLVRKLREQLGKDIFLMGGGELAGSFLQEDLIDRIELGILPILLGEGIPMFAAGFPQRGFKLLEQRSYPKTGLLTAKYARAR